MVEHCKDSVIDLDGDCAIQSSFSLFFFDGMQLWRPSMFLINLDF